LKISKKWLKCEIPVSLQEKPYPEKSELTVKLTFNIGDIQSKVVLSQEMNRCAPANSVLLKI